jgi:hypothetical protein
MQANPDKFQAISIGRKTHEKNLSFMLQGNKIDCEDEVKLLGVTFDFKLTFNSHVSHICKKASQQLTVLKRIGNNFLFPHASHLEVRSTNLLHHISVNANHTWWC